MPDVTVTDEDRRLASVWTFENLPDLDDEPHRAMSLAMLIARIRTEAEKRGRREAFEAVRSEARSYGFDEEQAETVIIAADNAEATLARDGAKR